MKEYIQLSKVVWMEYKRPIQTCFNPDSFYNIFHYSYNTIIKTQCKNELPYFPASSILPKHKTLETNYTHYSLDNNVIEKVNLL